MTELWIVITTDGTCKVAGLFLKQVNFLRWDSEEQEHCLCSKRVLNIVC